MTSPSHKYAIIDVETTGGNARTGRMTEIAIVIHDGETVIDTFESLINPEIGIPPFVQNLTGITDAMVEEAPYFYEIAKKVVEMTEGCIFVAHNVKFDYLFIRSEFERLGYTYQRRQLCTRQLTKKAFPQIGRYGLDRLIEYFDIQADVRHRAMADVIATIEVFEHLLRSDQQQDLFASQINHGIKLSKLPGTITVEDIHRISETSGIYYFFGENDYLLYVGKSKNIQKRVMQHFSNPTSRSIKFLERTRRIDYEETGSEITAILREDEVIKRERPEYNVAQRKTQKPYGLRLVEANTGIYFHLELHPIVDDQEEGFIQTYKSVRSGKAHVQALLGEFYLEGKLKLERTGSVWRTRNGEVNEEGFSHWSENFERLRKKLNTRRKFHYAVIDPTYSHHEATLFLFEYGRLVKTGQLDVNGEFSGVNLDEMPDCQPPLAINDQIITFIQRHQKRYKLKSLPG